MDYFKISNNVIGSLYSAHNHLKESPLDRCITVLVELRVSQINGCTYCCSLHAAEAKKLNISEEKLDCLSTWKSSNSVFSEKEWLALKWAEAITHFNLSHEQLLKIRKELSAVFTEREVVDLTAAASIMAALNRIAVCLK